MEPNSEEDSEVLHTFTSSGVYRVDPTKANNSQFRNSAVWGYISKGIYISKRQ